MQVTNVAGIYSLPYRGCPIIYCAGTIPGSTQECGEYRPVPCAIVRGHCPPNYNLNILQPTILETRYQAACIISQHREKVD